MAVVGAWLLVLRPGDRVLDLAGWVWPVPLLALTVWMAVQVRRSLASRARWLVYATFLVLAFASVGGAFETISRAHDRGAYPAPGTSYDVGGHRLHLACTGSGTPTVVLHNGLGGSSALWTRIMSEVGATTRVCAYDRAGQGWSDDVSAPQDGVAVADDLHALLRHAGETGPFVLAGHSAGGAYAMVYASRYPDEVAGMALLDSMSPYQFRLVPSFEGDYRMMRRGVALVPSLARVGVARLLPASMFTSRRGTAGAQIKALNASPRQYRSMRDELSTYPTLLEQAQQLSSLGGKPLVVLTATEQARTTKGWADAQAQMLALSPNHAQRFADATHDGVVDDADASATSVEAIVAVVESVSSGVPLSG
jgi:pimeloyl-ACP methyl ester carboxylesterase